MHFKMHQHPCSILPDASNTHCHLHLPAVRTRISPDVANVPWGGVYNGDCPQLKTTVGEIVTEIFVSKVMIHLGF